MYVCVCVYFLLISCFKLDVGLLGQHIIDNQN